MQIKGMDHAWISEDDNLFENKLLKMLVAIQFRNTLDVNVQNMKPEADLIKLFPLLLSL